jgi:hypothetical protein
MCDMFSSLLKSIAPSFSYLLYFDFFSLTFFVSLDVWGTKFSSVTEKKLDFVIFKGEFFPKLLFGVSTYFTLKQLFKSWQLLGDFKSDILQYQLYKTSNGNHSIYIDNHAIQKLDETELDG